MLSDGCSNYGSNNRTSLFDETVVLRTKIKTGNHSNVVIMENNKNKKIRKLVLCTFALILMCNSRGIPNKSDVCKHNLDNVIILSCHTAINYVFRCIHVFTFDIFSNYISYIQITHIL